MKNKFLSVLILFLAVVFASCPQVFAGEGTAGDYFSDMGKQTGRGLLNIVTSPAEIPCTMSDDIHEKGAGTGIFTGFGKGLAFMVRRIVIGVSEIATFIIPRSEASIAPVCQAKAPAAV